MSIEDIEKIDELYEKLEDQRHFYLELIGDKDKTIYQLRQLIARILEIIKEYEGSDENE